MCNQCVEELRSQAPVSEERGFTEVFDANTAVYISDTAVDIDTKMALRAGVAPLENVRDAVKEWHPGSDGKVLDLVHPSLYPLMYGTSRFLREGIVPLEACAQFSGLGGFVMATLGNINGYHVRYALTIQTMLSSLPTSTTFRLWPTSRSTKRSSR